MLNMHYASKTNLWCDVVKCLLSCQPRKNMVVKLVELAVIFAIFNTCCLCDDDIVPVDDSSTSYFNPPYDSLNPPEPLYSKSGVRLVTINELKAHGWEGPMRPLWLAVLGNVFDVDKGYDTHYGPKGGYNFFTGIDGSNAFVTGKFDEDGLIDDVLQLTPLELDEVEGWVRFYEKDYTYVGKLIGRFYDQTGNPTKYWYKYRNMLQEAADQKKKKKEQEKQFPPCNSRFVQDEGGSVSCSTKSGGIDRSWEGLPRRYFIPGTKDWRCACVNEPDLDNPHVKLYPGCGPKDRTCKIDKKKLKEEL